ncbi:hypothetical protein C9374_007754 [Naegleria lovaniensis]|uniref:Uncharacterized protein n=1 Tax=Naegleria lovaniensis TaxID=51637 RepID=A0AA88GMH1_NAELO|nr:uncharacterized protein C9374_007754 [Naegleria lovaniensis]KAG2379116.1 hypothetical protein C9374_007754 [Naegleria lovaniensis]
MGMFHSTSGKSGYNLYLRPTPVVIEKETAILLLKEEQRLRRDPRTQQAYTEADDDLFQIERITMDLQEQVVANVLGLKRNQGLMYDEAFNNFMVAYRNLRCRFRNDPDINTLTDYFKYDMSRACSLELNTCLDLSSIKVVDLMNFYEESNRRNNHQALLEIPSSELALNYKVTLSELLQQRNPNNLPVVLIGASYS